MNKEELIELMIARLAAVPVPPVLILLSLTGLMAGAFMVINPHLSIEIQKRFYYLINWKIEPVSLSKEIRNTRIMGWLLLFLSAATLLFVFAKYPLFS